MQNLDVSIEYGTCSFKKVAEINEDVPSDEPEEKLEEIIRSGSLYFDEHTADTRHIPFMLTPYIVNMRDIFSKLLDEWKLPLPRIVLFAISSSISSPSEHQRKLNHKLVKGIMHALNTTEMWLCTDGLNRGLSSEIGSAFESEILRRKCLLSTTHKIQVSAFPETALIGICRQEDLYFSDKFREQQNNGESSNSNVIVKHDISRRHDYFIFVRDNTERKNGLSHFILNFANHLREYVRIKRKTEAVVKPHRFAVRVSEIPVMALLVHGKVTEIDLVLGYLKHGLPLIVIQGSGGLADLLSFAYYQITCRPEGTNIAEYHEVVLKPQIIDKINRIYPNLYEYKISERTLCQKIFDCIRYSRQHDQGFLTILSLRDIQYESSHLPCHLLTALFKSQTSDNIKDAKQLKKDLFLAMDWNSPDVAMTEVFARDPSSKFQIDNETFFRALIKPNREQFVALFLNQGFLIRSFLDSSTLLELFQNSLNKEFFRTIVWESVLGFGSTVEISRNFVDSKLIILLEELTGVPSLINTYELDWNYREIYDDRTPEEAERKATAVLALWGILSYRVNLVKVLWKYSEQPVHLALICSVILKKLQAYVSDLSLKNEMEKQSKEFSQMATSLMDKCYDRNPSRAIDLLCERNRIWSYKSVVEIAAYAKNRRFLAHPCCQKYLDNLFMGKIKIRDLPYGDVTIPQWLKIVLSTFLVFPMYLWIRFDVSDAAENPLKNEISSSRQSLLAADGDKTSKRSEHDTSKHMSFEKPKERNLWFWSKIYYLWTAPITKFWVSQIFYSLYLFCFSLAVIWPACGSLYLDFITCVWTGIIIIDLGYNAFSISQKFSGVRMFYKYTEIVIMSSFLICYVLSRITWHRQFMSPYSAKVMLCIALLYCYYRLIFLSFPISSELGPMLYRVKRMTLVDFMGFIRVTGLVIISNGIVIHATIYPDYPLNWELVKRTFFNALVSFFLTPADQFGIPDPKCIKLIRHSNMQSFIGLPENICKVGRYLKPDCPNPGLWPYLFGLQYLMILRLILLTLLYALFSNTHMKLQAEGTYIWKYQRYELVTDFSNRLVFPPPLSPINYIIMFFKYIDDLLFGAEKEDHDESVILSKYDFLYWKSLASEYYQQTQQSKEDEKKTRWRMEKEHSLMNALNEQRHTMRDLQGYLTDLQIQIKNAHQYLERAMLQVSTNERLQTKGIPQIFSRISPYPNTKISRCPVSDKHVPWQCAWTTYDPIAYTKPSEDFPKDLRHHVDVDIQLRREIEGEEFRMPVFKWNMSSVSPGGVYLDRQSWILEKQRDPFIYDLDSEELPMNPMGRTGLRGRGCLPRWGPNHYIYVIITRWKETEILSLHSYLEVVIMVSEQEVTLPGGYVSTENIYLVIKSLFHCEEAWRTSSDMIEFFESLVQLNQTPVASTSTHTPAVRRSTSGDISDDPLVFDMIKRGYLDEATNTDQAWCEAEIWHFHYNAPCSIDEKFKAPLIWMELNEILLERIPIGQAAFLHTVAKKMKAVLEVT